MEGVAILSSSTYSKCCYTETEGLTFLESNA